VEALGSSDQLGISDVLCRFFLAFDERDWEAMANCLAAEVFIDYSSSGREQPGVMSGHDFVQRRRGVVDTLLKHHSFSNLLLSKEADGVRARCNYLILRFNPEHQGEGEDYYHSCGAYEFLFRKAQDSWKIASITQRALRSWGNRELHGGSRKAQS
jgi:3-phenylpropionate/cinnamic acid dioxygenase small subunit